MSISRVALATGSSVALVREGAVIAMEVSPCRSLVSYLPPVTLRSATAQMRIDTGASHSMISIELAQQLRLIPIGFTDVRFALGDRQECPVYRVDLGLRATDEEGRRTTIYVPSTVLGRRSPAGPETGLLGREFLKSVHLEWNGPAGHVGLSLRHAPA